MLKNKPLAAIFLIVFIDLLGFSLILPLLPYYAKTFEANDFMIGLLVASYAAAQLIGAPILGRLSDEYGRRPILLISIAGNIVGFILLAVAQNITMLFIARMLAGLTAANISVAQAYIADVTDEKNRAQGLGMIGAAFGLGFIIGPAVGGVLSQSGFAVPAFAAAGLSTLNFVLVLSWLPESLTAERRQLLSNNQRPPFTIKALFAALRQPKIGPLLHTRFFFGLASAILQTMFSLYTLNRFDLDAQNTGYILAYVGLLSVITQGFIVGKLTTRFSENWLIFSASFLLIFGLLGWALSPTVFVLLIVTVPIALATGVFNTVINSAITKTVPPIQVGGMLGISSALEAGTRVLAPTVGGFLLNYVGNRLGAFAGTAAPGIVATLIMVWLVTYIYRFIHPGTRYYEDESIVV